MNVDATIPPITGPGVSWMAENDNLQATAEFISVPGQLAADHALFWSGILLATAVSLMVWAGGIAFELYR